MSYLSEQEAEARRQLAARMREALALNDAGDTHALELKIRGVMEAADIWRSARCVHRKSWRGVA